MFGQMKRTLPFAFLLFPLNLLAQLNDKDTTNWQGKLSCSGLFMKGNVNRLILINKLEVAYANRDWGASNRTDYQFGTINSVRSENDWVSYNFLYLKPLNRWYPFFMGVVETNLRRKIDFRVQTGIGVTHSLVRKPGRVLKLSVTGTYDYTKFEGNKFYLINDSSSNSIATPRLIGRIYGKQSIISGGLNCLYEVWWQQSIVDKKNFRFYSEQSFELPLFPPLTFKTTVRYTYESIGLRGLKPYDLLLMIGLSVNSQGWRREDGNGK
jgi:hypothetical protein